MLFTVALIALPLLVAADRRLAIIAAEKRELQTRRRLLCCGRLRGGVRGARSAAGYPELAPAAQS